MRDAGLEGVGEIDELLGLDDCQGVGQGRVRNCLGSFPLVVVLQGQLDLLEVVHNLPVPCGLSCPPHGDEGDGHSEHADEESNPEQNSQNDQEDDTSLLAFCIRHCCTR